MGMRAGDWRIGGSRLSGLRFLSLTRVFRCALSREKRLKAHASGVQHGYIDETSLHLVKWFGDGTGASMSNMQSNPTAAMNPSGHNGRALSLAL